MSKSINTFLENIDFLYLLGVYFGDGHIYYVHSSYQLSIVSEDIDLCENCLNICQALFGAKGTISKVDNYFKFVLCSKDVCDIILSILCSNVNYYEATKEEKKDILPEFYNTDLLKSFISGLMDSDGWIRETVNGNYLKYEIGFKNTNKNTMAIKYLMESVGLKCSKTTVKTGNDKQKTFWSWTINPKSFINNISFRIERKISLANKYTESKKCKNIKDENLIIRLTQEEKSAIEQKSLLSNKKISTLIREAIWSYWPDGKIPADKLLQLYLSSNEQEKLAIVEIVYKHYRQQGYPYSILTHKKLIPEMKKLSSSSEVLLENSHLQTNKVGINIANYFHPHMEGVKCMQHYLSPLQAYQSNAKLKDCIKRWFDLGNKPTPSGIRKILRTRDGVRSVVNFKPAIAKYFYQNYCPENGNVLDPCAGYGGRLTGLISSRKNLLYHGIDPCPKTAIGNMKLAGFYSSQYSPIIKELLFPFRFKFDLGCAEDIMPTLNMNYYDLIFTSPPYFNTEQYDKLPNQSYIRYPEYNIWVNKFLSPLIAESYRVCKIDGYFILNVKNYKTKPIADDSLEYAKKVGFELVKTYQMRLSNSEFNRKEGELKYHSEPIFVFKKNL